MDARLEQTVLTVVGSVLGREALALSDDFFAVGGTSLAAAVVITHLQRLLGTDVPLRALMENSVLGSFVTALSRSLAQAGMQRAAPGGMRDG